ncbi:MAG: GspE/PulE family protein [Candidatus Paceibacterota bacterium]
MAEPATATTQNSNEPRISSEVLKFVPADAAEHYRFIPLAEEDDVLLVGMVDPDDIDARDAIQFISAKTNVPFKIKPISQEEFDKAFKSYEGLSGQVDRALGQLDNKLGQKSLKSVSVKTEPSEEEKKSSANNIVEDAPVTKIVSVILQHATTGNASDIHIEPTAEQLKVRFRVDGILYTSLFLPKKVADAVVARIKILTNMKLDEKRKPQDGRFSAKVSGRKIDFRVSTFPTYFGEKVVMRILDPKKQLITLHSLGFNDNHLAAVKRALNKPYGLILLTGPTGSGKTTSLYSMLSEIDREKHNVVSLEDPIEYDISGINQSQVRPEIDYTFANGLRSILRQDPDIIMVGEIRDSETAKLAIQASLTGHLVFSTIHTNNALGVVPRLIDMGVDPYLIPPTLALVVAQRLVPALCPDSKETTPVEGSIKAMIDKQLSDLPAEFRDKIQIPETVYRAVGSPSCPSGTKGRIGAFEVIEMTDELEKLILTSPGEQEIYDHVREKGFISLREDALFKAFAGTIPIEEINKL